VQIESINLGLLFTLLDVEVPIVAKSQK